MKLYGCRASVLGSRESEEAYPDVRSFPTAPPDPGRTLTCPPPLVLPIVSTGCDPEPLSLFRDVQVLSSTTSGISCRIGLLMPSLPSARELSREVSDELEAYTSNHTSIDRVGSIIIID